MAAGIDQVSPQRRLLGRQPAAKAAVSAITAAAHVPGNRPVRETELLESALEDGIRPIPGTLVRVDVEPGLDGVVMLIEVIIDAERAPLIANRCRQAERGAPVDHGAAADGAARQERDRPIGSGGNPAIDEERGKAGELAPIELSLRADN